MTRLSWAATESKCSIQTVPTDASAACPGSHYTDAPFGPSNPHEQTCVTASGPCVGDSGGRPCTPKGYAGRAIRHEPENDSHP